MLIGHNKNELLEKNICYLRESFSLDVEQEEHLRNMFNYPYNLRSFMEEVWVIEAQRNTVSYDANLPKVGGRYIILCKNPVGRGGMGEVYPFWDEEEQQIVCIKIARCSLGTKRSEMQRRLMREADILRRLQDIELRGLRGISNFIELSCDDFSFLGADNQYQRDAIYLVMEYIEGSTLEDFVMAHGNPYYDACRQQGRTLDDQLNKILKYIHEVAKNLDALHRKGLVHRDIKPSNILINPQNQAIIIDFGIAQRSEVGGKFGDKKSITVAIGTPNYMDPNIRFSTESWAEIVQSLENKDWKSFRENVSPFFNYSVRTKPLKKVMQKLHLKMFFQKLCFKKTEIGNEDWQNLENIVADIKLCSDPKEDSYSLGASLYTCLTGKSVYDNSIIPKLDIISLCRNMRAIDFEKREDIVKTMVYLEKILVRTLQKIPLKELPVAIWQEP